MHHSEQDKINCSPVRDLNSRPLVYKTSALTTELTRLTHLQCSFTLYALNLFSRVCALIQRTVYLTCRYETHIFGWEHSINVVSDSYPGNKQKFLGLISEKKILGGTLVDKVKLKEITCVKENIELALFRVLKCYLWHQDPKFCPKQTM